MTLWTPPPWAMPPPAFHVPPAPAPNTWEQAYWRRRTGTWHATSPSIASVGAGVTSPAGTTLTVVMPGSIAAGNLLLCFLFLDQTNSGDAYRNQFPAGWVVLDAIANTTSSITCQMAYKKADGSESNFNLTTASIISRSRVYRITGAADPTVQPPVACGWQGGNAASGPPVVANEWPTQDILAILATTWENTTPSGGVSGYTNEFNAGSGSLGARCDTKAISSVNSEDPAAYTTGSGNRAGYVCIVPSDAGDPDLTYPIVRNEVRFRSSTGATTAVCPLPIQRQAGDIVAIVLQMIVNVSISSGIPSGWTTEVSVVGGGSGGERLYVLWKRIDGSEADSFTVNLSGSSANGCLGFAILNVDSDADVISGTNTGSGTTPDPPNLSANADLWMAVAESESAAYTAFPANYTHKQYTVSASGASGHSIGVAFRQLAATSENPGTFTAGSSTFWATATVAFGKANPRFFQAAWVH